MAGVTTAMANTSLVPPVLGIIYALAEPCSHDIRYCGKTVASLVARMYAHRSDVRRQSHRHLYRWLAKLHEAGLEPETMICEEIVLDGLSRSDQLKLLNEAEKRWIQQFKVLGFRLTNGTNGGDGCHGRVVSAETKAKQSRSNFGQKRSPETCLKMSESAKKRPLSDRLRGETHPHFGKTQNWKDPEARAEKLRGEKNPHASLTSLQALQIYAEDDALTFKEIAARHKTTAKVVCDIKTGKTWRKITDHNPDTYQRRKRGHN
jgi:hypothetical protein